VLPPIASGVDAAIPSVTDAAAEPDALVDAEPSSVTQDGGNTECSDKILGLSLKSARCTSDSECQLRTSECCGPCGQVPAERLRAVSIHDDLACAGVGCGQCASWMPKDFSARCIQNRCNVVQTTCEARSTCARVRKPALLAHVLDRSLSACRTDDECALGTRNCCNCGLSGGTAVVAYSRRTPYKCAGGHQCPDCVDNGPDPALKAACVGGRCRVKDTGLDSECLIDERTSR
jgi:hypothetical protein